MQSWRRQDCFPMREKESQLVCLKGQIRYFFSLGVCEWSLIPIKLIRHHITSTLLKSMASQLLLKKAQILTLECNLFLSALTSHHSPCCCFYMLPSKGFCICFFLEFLSHSHRHGSLSPPLSLLMYPIPSLPTLFEIVYLLAHPTIPLIYYQTYLFIHCLFTRL